MSAFPPQRTITSIPVSKSTALTYLSAYLTCSETQPHLLPNTRLDPSGGPTVGSSKHSVTIHNLKRVEAGLRGEWLAPSLQLGSDEMVTSSTRVNKKLENTNENACDLMDLIENPIIHVNNTSELTEEYVEESQDVITSPTSRSKLVSDFNANKDVLPLIKKTNELSREARKAEKKARRKLQKKTAQNPAQK